jgi:hypothetical protein
MELSNSFKEVVNHININKNNYHSVTPIFYYIDPVYDYGLRHNLNMCFPSIYDCVEVNWHKTRKLHARIGYLFEDLYLDKFKKTLFEGLSNDRHVWINFGYDFDKDKYNKIVFNVLKRRILITGINYSGGEDKYTIDYNHF